MKKLLFFTLILSCFAGIQAMERVTFAQAAQTAALQQENIPYNPYLNRFNRYWNEAKHATLQGWYFGAAVAQTGYVQGLEIGSRLSNDQERTKMIKKTLKTVRKTDKKLKRHTNLNLTDLVTAGFSGTYLAHKMKAKGALKAIALFPVATAYATGKAYEWASNNPVQAASIAFAAGAWWNDMKKSESEKK